jgi:hypothetical protein
MSDISFLLHGMLFQKLYICFITLGFYFFYPIMFFIYKNSRHERVETAVGLSQIRGSISRASLHRGVLVALIYSVLSLQPGLGADFAVPCEAADLDPRPRKICRYKKGFDYLTGYLCLPQSNSCRENRQFLGKSLFPFSK